MLKSQKTKTLQLPPQHNYYTRSKSIADRIADKNNLTTDKKTFTLSESSKPEPITKFSDLKPDVTNDSFNKFLPSPLRPESPNLKGFDKLNFESDIALTPFKFGLASSTPVNDRPTKSSIKTPNVDTQKLIIPESLKKKVQFFDDTPEKDTISVKTGHSLSTPKETVVLTRSSEEPESVLPSKDLGRSLRASDNLLTPDQLGSSQTIPSAPIEDNRKIPLDKPPAYEHFTPQNEHQIKQEPLKTHADIQDKSVTCTSNVEEHLRHLLASPHNNTFTEQPKTPSDFDNFVSNKSTVQVRPVIHEKVCTPTVFKDCDSNGVSINFQEGESKDKGKEQGKDEDKVSYNPFVSLDSHKNYSENRFDDINVKLNFDNNKSSQNSGSPSFHYSTNMSSALKLDKFQGESGNEALSWLTRFLQWAQFYDLPDHKKVSAFPFHLTSHALLWYKLLDAKTKNDLTLLINAFKTRFKKSSSHIDLSILKCVQKPGESVSDYLGRLVYLTNNNNVPESMTLAIAIQGLNSDLRSLVINKEPSTFDELRHAAELAEKALSSGNNESKVNYQSMLNAIESLREDVKSSTATIEQLKTENEINSLVMTNSVSKDQPNVPKETVIYNRDVPQYRQQRFNDRFPSQPRMSFNNNNNASRNTNYNNDRRNGRFPSSNYQYTQRPYNNNGYNSSQYNNNTDREKCMFCGRSPHARSQCPARDVTCHCCGKNGHYSRLCLSAKRNK